MIPCLSGLEYLSIIILMKIEFWRPRNITGCLTDIIIRSTFDYFCYIQNQNSNRAITQ